MISQRVPTARLFFAAAITIFGFLNNLALAQEYPYTPSYAPAPPVTPDQQIQPSSYTPDQLDQMLGPIALYPDPLLSQVLAASTYPQDIAAAGQWIQSNPSPSDDTVNSQPWDASVKALVRFPDLLQTLAGNMDWTEALGNAFAAQQNDVMDSVQRLRTQAQSLKTLQSTPQQQVIQDNGAIEILPAQPDVIYVPQYDPAIVYTQPYYDTPFLTFGSPYPFGFFFDLGFDFHNHRFFHGRFDNNHHFDYGDPWHHDPHRPIPPPRRPFFPPSRPGGRPGSNQPARPPGAFHPITPPRAPAQNPRPAQRPVTNIPRTPPRVTPAPRTPAAPVVRPPAATPRPAPSIPRPTIHPPVKPTPPRVQRPVTGLPARPAPVQRPVQSPRPAVQTPRPTAPARAPSPAFHPNSGGGNAASSRGHDSMRH